MENQNLTHWKKQFNYDYLGSYSLPDEKQVTLTIKETKKEMVMGSGGKKEECFVCYFVEKYDWVKPMILNRTNCKIIEKVHNTPFIEEWSGKKICIGIDKNIKAFGDVVDALRVRLVVPKESGKKKVTDFDGVVKALKTGAYKLEQIQAAYDLTDSQLAELKSIKVEPKTETK